MSESSQNGQKTLWDKEKLLIMSNFSFCHCVFERRVLQTRKNQGLFGKGLTEKRDNGGTSMCFVLLFVILALTFVLVFTILKNNPIENIVGKG